MIEVHVVVVDRREGRAHAADAVERQLDLVKPVPAGGVTGPVTCVQTFVVIGVTVATLPVPFAAPQAASENKLVVMVTALRAATAVVRYQNEAL